MRPAVSVIIPTWQEAAGIEATIRAVRGCGSCEILVCDGGSSDGTIHRCGLADRVLTSDPGRAKQLNAGAAAARGEILWFLHADCRPATGAIAAIERALADSAVIGGAFSQEIDHPGLVYRVIEHGNGLRVRLSGWIYGDQGMFVRREVFEKLGGFPDLPLMEDLYFSKQLRQQGRIVLLKERLLVSARRWEQDGPISRTLMNWRLILQAHRGVPLDQLAKEYRTKRGIADD